ncbi:hypothetical protein E3N88_17704 [Mikania micrantha]|uniref:Uncharacterized protein n=1 Tax=Mikania micrantha TaxID=192012 RepID=A0A5N6NVB6_9ASTR|nr:hypothetical protein E3N88_17704 [Mikania micrantha]
MTINLNFPVFAGNPIRSKTPKSRTSAHAIQPYKPQRVNLISNIHHRLNSRNDIWASGWFSFGDFEDLFKGGEVKLSEELLVCLGCKTIQIEEEDNNKHTRFKIPLLGSGRSVRIYGQSIGCGSILLYDKSPSRVGSGETEEEDNVVYWAIDKGTWPESVLAS